MTATTRHISVCVCTFKRPEGLARLLDRLERLETGGAFTYSVVIADNDANESARDVAASAAVRGKLDLVYSCERRQNIAAARNMTLSKATGDFLAFIDDDEFPEPDWLVSMLRTCEAYGVAGVLGPVRPHFERPPPQWIIDGGFCDRPEHVTGRPMPWDECRTGNVLLRRSILAASPKPFDEQFGTGGEDKDFFMRMEQQGHAFIWCNEGVVYEEVPPERQTRGYMLRRALLRGQNIIKHPVGQAGLIARSLVAIPGYIALLPFTVAFGQHVVMKYLIKLCDHAGRVLALVGLNPVRER